MFTILTACQPQQITRDAGTANALLALRADYDAARAALRNELPNLPPPVATELLALERRADLLVEAVTAAWTSRDPLALSMASMWVDEGLAIYERGRELVEPHWDDLSLEARASLIALSRDVERIRGAAARMRETDYDEYARAALELVTLALRVAAMAM